MREAELPFVATVTSQVDPSSAVLARCCQGLAANTLAKRLRDWHQFRRYLVLEGVVPPFPRGEADVLDYLGSALTSKFPRLVLRILSRPAALWSWREKCARNSSCTA